MTGSNARERMAKGKRELRTLENMYVNNKLDNLDEIIEEKKNELTDLLVEYNSKMVTTKYTTKGDEYKVPNINPIVIQNYFFKSLNPIGNREPKYNAEKLAIVWQLYLDIVTEVNIRIGDFTPTVTSFCSFAGITTSTFNGYKRSEDVDLRIVQEKITDYCFDSNVTLAQNGTIKESSTMYRMKVEQGKTEKQGNQIHIHTDGLNLDVVKDRLKELQDFNNKKQEAIEVEKEEIQEQTEEIKIINLEDI